MAFTPASTAAAPVCPRSCWVNGSPSQRSRTVPRVTRSHSPAISPSSTTQLLPLAISSCLLRRLSPSKQLLLLGGDLLSDCSTHGKSGNWVRREKVMVHSG